MIDYLRSRRVARFHHGGIGGHLDLLLRRPDGERDVNRDVIADGKQNAGLKILREAAGRHLQAVGSYREVGHDVGAARIGNGGMDGVGFGLCRRELRAWRGGAGRVPDHSGDLRSSYRLAAEPDC